MNHWDSEAPRPGRQLPAGLTFDIRRFGGRTSISEEVLRTAEAHTELDRVMGELIVGIDVRVLSHRLLSREQVQTVGFPASPWQHFKAHFAPRWFIRRWPVQKHWADITFHVDVDAAFPQSMIPLSETRLGPASFHEDAHFETETYGQPYIEYRQVPMRYQELRNYYAEAADREARIKAGLPRHLR
ncbi:MAG TPA: hypothetical protein VFL72_05745 [Acidimicrobiia bacterium]|nr:hypothetical protein [Acidimicrobiia bacterium]